MTVWLSLSLVLVLAPPALTLAFARAPSLRLAVLYDGHCGMCMRWVAVMNALDWARRLDARSLRDAASVATRFPSLDPRELERDLHVVDARGGVRRGYSAYRWIAWRLPLLAPLAFLLYVPGIKRLGDRVYRRIADGRRVDCGDAAGACSVREERRP